jgi:DNA-binding MarR family transcriptional regulator
MYELYHRSTLTASDIIALIDIDKGYLSRILKKFERSKLINKINSSSDKRASVIQLSPKGKKEFETLNKASDKQIEMFLKNLPDKDCDELIKKINAAQKLLKKGLGHD